MQYDAPPDNGGDKPAFIPAYPPYMAMDIYFRLTGFLITVIVAPPRHSCQGIAFSASRCQLRAVIGGRATLWRACFKGSSVPQGLSLPRGTNQWTRG